MLLRQLPRLSAVQPSRSSRVPRSRIRSYSTRARAAAAEQVMDTASTSGEEIAPKAHLVDFKDGVYTVEGAFTTAASTSQVWDVLTDYDRLADVFSNIKSSQVVSREPEIVLHQDCKWEFLIFSGKFGTRLTVKEDWQRMALTFELIESSFMRSFVGQWQIEPRKAGGGALVRHRLAIKSVVSPPAFMTGYTQKIFVQQVASILRDLEGEMRRHWAGNYAQYADL